MANLIYRLTSDTPVRSASTVKNLPLSNVEIDGNFKVIDDELALKAPLASPALTGIPTAPTAAGGTNTTQLATTAFVLNERTTERSATATLTNKTISVDDNTVSGIAASSFVLSNASGNIDGAALQKAIPAGVVVGTTDTQTLTNKTISVDNNTVSGIAASSFVLSNASGNIDGAAATKAIPAGVVVGTTDTQTLTNKTISVDDNTVSGIAASSFVLSNASGNIDGAAAQKAIPSGVVVGTTDTQTLTNKTISSSSFSGSVTGTSVSATSLSVTGNSALKTYTQTTVSLTASGSATLNLNDADVFIVTLAANSTISFSNPPASGTFKNILVILLQDGVGNRTASFTNARYTDGVAPVLTTTANARDVLSFFTYDAGSNYFGSFVMADVK